MVRILANGDIVQDDDPRVQQTSSGPRNRYGTVNHGENDDPQYHAQSGIFNNGENGPTMFDTWNQKLLELGIPRWNVGTHVVEPLIDRKSVV
uniref:Uncharacterized protein C10orf35 homolog n=1 Tax=Phallusia mammillata TaxID=59560 RepID=A0A6F9DCE9_9ASCI|nr:uncharacterized protein C10orf35 homolog [Phallusia mammillata]